MSDSCPLKFPRRYRKNSKRAESKPDIFGIHSGHFGHFAKSTLKLTEVCRSCCKTRQFEYNNIMNYKRYFIPNSIIFATIVMAKRRRILLNNISCRVGKMKCAHL